MRILSTVVLSTFLLLTQLLAHQAFASEVALKVSAPFINVHSGPGSEFPVFHVLSQGEVFTLKKERTAWYKVETTKGIEGWIAASSLAHTELADGSKITVEAGSFADYLERSWEVNVGGGVVDNVTAMSVGGAWVWSKNLAIEGTFSQALGNYSDNKVWSLRMRQTFFADWQISPYLALGTGEIRTNPRSNLVQSGAETRTISHYEVGIGAQYYVASKVLLRAEYRSLLALTQRDEQERLDQWMLGVSIFF